jgi:Kef-type K+ transport system membrane component KefB
VTPEARLSVLVAGALAAAWFTESIGLHLIFGPFLLGLCVPRHAATLDHLHTRIAELSTSLLLPAFFVVAGLGVDLTTLGSGGLVLLAATLALAMLGKIGGTALPAVGLGMHRREALTLGALMNTRGLTELVLLSVGASVGLLDTQLYTVLVATAVITTVSTGPLLTLLRAPPRPSNPVALEASQDAHSEGPDLPRVPAGGRR